MVVVVVVVVVVVAGKGGLDNRSIELISIILVVSVIGALIAADVIVFYFKSENNETQEFVMNGTIVL